MLLTLAASSLRSKLWLKPGRPAAGTMLLRDLPRYVRETLGLHGLNVSTDLLAGADVPQLDALRDAADKASCPCLVLIRNEPLPFFSGNDAKGDDAIERMTRVVQAAHRLGCNSAALFISQETDGEEDAFDLAAERLRKVMSAAEKREVNLLLGTGKGLTAEPDRLTDLIKRVGGFRIGTFPDYQAAAAHSDPLTFLRRLTPYASAVTASTIGFKTGKKGPEHQGYDLVDFTKAVVAVGYTGTLAIDYRGDGDPETGIRNSRAVLESVVGVEVTEPS